MKKLFNAPIAAALAAATSLTATSCRPSTTTAAAEQQTATDSTTTALAAADSINNICRETFETESGKTISFGLIKHGSLSIGFDGYEIEVDPVTNLGEQKTDYALLPKADLILVTHEHFDHLDSTAIAALTKENTLLFINERGRETLGKGDVLHNGDERTVGRTASGEEIVLKAVAAYNTTEGHTQFHPKGAGNGYVLDMGGKRIYIAGDTEDIEEMAELKDIDIAFLPVNQPFTMTVEQAARAAKMFMPKVLIPYHYGETEIGLLADELKESGIEVRIRPMQ